MRRAILLAACLLAAKTAAGYCVIGSADDRSASIETCGRFCLGEVGLMAPVGLAGRVLEFEVMYGGLRLGVAGAEGFSGLEGTSVGALVPVHVGFTLASQYDPNGSPVTSLRELLIEVAAGIQPGSPPLGVLYRGAVRCAVVRYSIGLALEAGAILRQAPGGESATPYVALLFQLPTIVFPLASVPRTLGSGLKCTAVRTF